MKKGGCSKGTSPEMSGVAGRALAVAEAEEVTMWSMVESPSKVSSFHTLRAFPEQ